VVHRGRHQEHHSRTREEDACEENCPLKPGRLREPSLKGRGEQKREQHLGARERHPKLVQELDQLAIRLLLLRLGHS
jgi:hypothetical protein